MHTNAAGLRRLHRSAVANLMENHVPSAQIQAGCWGVTVMSLVSGVEPHQPGEESDAGRRRDQPHVLRDTRQTMEDQGQSQEKEMDMLNPESEVVNKDEPQKEMWRKGATQRMPRRRVKQTDGTMAGVYECVSVLIMFS